MLLRSGCVPLAASAAASNPDTVPRLGRLLFCCSPAVLLLLLLLLSFWPVALSLADALVRAELQQTAIIAGFVSATSVPLP
jgi:hypothetical protein